MYRIYPASPEAKARCPEGFADQPNAFMLEPSAGKASKYPFRRLAIGTCFCVPFADLPMSGLQTIRSAVETANRALKPKKYVCIVHPNEQLVEVARIL